MKSNLTKALTLSFLLALTIFTICKPDIRNKIISSLKAKSFTIRNLEEKTIQDIQKEICEKSSSSLMEFYQNQNSNYTFTVAKGNELIPEIFNKDIVKGIPETKQTDYLYSNYGYIFLAILWIICVILWLPFCCCVTCRSCFCPKIFTKCPKPLLLLTIALSCCVIFLCTIGYTENSGVMNGIFGFGCSVLKLEDHFARGDEYKVKPYWIGLQGALDIMNETQGKIEDVTTQAQLLKPQIDSIDTEFFKDELDTEYELKKEYKVTNPNPNKEKFTPGYLSAYGPTTQEDTVLGLINKEFNEFASTSIDSLNQIVDVAALSDSKTEEITSQLEKFQKYAKNIIDKADGYITSTVGKYIDYLNQADTGFRTSMNTLFTANLIIGIAFTASLVLIFLCKIGKCSLCLSWIFLYALMICTFLCGIIFGVAGTIFQDAAYGGSCLLKDIKNVEIVEDPSTMQLIDTCLNGNGSISTGEMFDLSSKTEIIESIYNLEKSITEGVQKLKEYDLLSITESTNNFDKVLKDEKTYVPELKQALEEVREYTDLSADSTYVSESTPIYDVWEIRQSDCPAGYQYLSPPNTRRLAEEDNKKYCLVITEWNSNDISSRYSPYKTTIDGEKNDVLTFALPYYNMINSFLSENKQLINDLKITNDNFQKSFKNFVNEEVKILYKVKDVIHPIRETFEELLGENSLMDMLNCGFLKRDTYKILEVMYEILGGEILKTSKIFIWISLLELLLTFFLLTLMSAYNNKQKSSIEIEKV